jgi:hypothetical protein
MKWVIYLVIILLFSCKNEEKAESGETNFFPIKSFLQSQVTHIDTSIYAIQKITKVNDQSDTVFIKREEFRQYAKDFLDIPDISQKKWRNDYNEFKTFDESLNSAVLVYTPKEMDDAEIRRQEVHIQPDAGSGDKVKTIFVELSSEKRKSIIHKKMLWEIDKWFRITTITQTENEPEKIETIQVIWSH